MFHAWSAWILLIGLGQIAEIQLFNSELRETLIDKALIAFECCGRGTL